MISNIIELKSQFKFIKDEITREKEKKRTRCSYGLRNKFNTDGRFKTTQKFNTSNQFILGREKFMETDMWKLMRRVSRSKATISRETLKKFESTFSNPIK
jgi:isocitrate dehydrogenase kinase/phosphatase